MNTPLRDEILQYVEAAYLHGLSCENLDTNELEPPKDISEVEWIADSILNKVASKMPEKKKLVPNSYGYSKRIGYNQAITEVKSILKGGG